MQNYKNLIQYNIYVHMCMHIMLRTKGGEFHVQE